MKLEFKVFGVSQLKGMMTRVGKGIRDFTPAWRKIANDFFETEEKLFRTEGGTGAHGRWTPLSPKYAAWKSANFPARPILVLSGHLAQSLTSGNEDTINEVSPLVLKIGTADRLGVVHFHGTRSMPRRRPIDLSSKDKSRWFKIIQAYIAKLFGGLTGR